MSASTRWVVFGLSLAAATFGCSSAGEEANDPAAGGNGTAGGGGFSAGGSNGGSAGSGGSGSAGGAGAAGAGGTAGSGAGAGGANASGSAGVAGSAGSGGAAAEPIELHITTSNIRYGTADDGVNAWEKRKALLFQVLTAQAFDSAGLQEALAFQLDELDDALPDYGRVGVGRDDGKTKGEYSAILYKKSRFEAVASGTFWFSDTPETPGSKSWGNTLPRICTWARFKSLESGRYYYHYNVHLDHLSQPSREKSAQLLAARIVARPDKTDPVIVTGDFNAEPDNLAITYMLGTAPIEAMQSPYKVADAWLELHGTDPDSTTHHSFEGGTAGGIHIDYVMYGPGVTVKSAEIIRTHEGDVYPSDHYPLSAVLTLTP